MSEDNGHVSESKSSVEIALNSKGEGQPKIKLYDGVTEEEIVRLRVLAVAQFHELLKAVGR